MESVVRNRSQSAARMRKRGVRRSRSLYAEACGLACGPTVSGFNKAMRAVAHGRLGSDRLGVLKAPNYYYNSTSARFAANYVKKKSRTAFA